MPEAQTILQDLRNFVAREILAGQDVGLDATTPLLEYGLIDSMSIAKLVAFIKESYAMDLPHRELRPENLKTLTALTDLVVRLQAKAR